MTTENNTKEIDCRDLFWHLLSKWRSLLAFMLIFAILAGAYKIYSNYKTNKANQATNAAAEQSLTDADNQEAKTTTLTPAEASAVKNATDYLKILQKYEAYQNNSIYIQCDPNAKRIQELTYIIRVKNSSLRNPNIYNIADSCLNACTNYINSGAVVSELDSDAIGIESSMIKELLSAYEVSYAHDNLQIKLTDSSSGTDSTFALFTIIISALEDNQIEAISEELQAIIPSYACDLSDDAESTIECEVYSKHNSTIFDNNLLAAQLSLLNNIISYRNAYTNSISAFNENQIAAFKDINGIDLANLQFPSDISEEPGMNGEITLLPDIPLTSGFIKYIILGLFAGLFILMIIYIISYILGHKVHTSIDISSIYDAFILSDFSGLHKSSAHFGKALDNWITSKRYSQHLTNDESKNLLISNIMGLCEKDNISSIFITSSSPMNNSDEALINEIINSLSKQNIKASFGMSIIKDITSFQNMKSQDAVIIVEKLLQSSSIEISEISNIIKQQNVKTLGVCIL